MWWEYTGSVLDAVLDRLKRTERAGWPRGELGLGRSHIRFKYPIVHVLQRGWWCDGDAVSGGRADTHGNRGISVTSVPTEAYVK